MTARARMAALAALGALAACDDAQTVTIPAVERGRELFADPDFSASQFNVFACATCHGTTDAAPTIALSLAHVTDRAGWWDGNEASLLDAVDFCWSNFMRGYPALDPTSDDARALFEYLASLGDGAPRAANRFTVAESIADPGPGDATHGAALWQRSCARCHGATHSGQGRLGTLVSIVPEASQQFAADHGFDLRLVIVEKIRHGRFFGVGGNMPFYPTEILSDSDVADLLEYLAP